MLTGSAITRALVIVVLAAGLAGLWQFLMPRATGPHLSEPPKVGGTKGDSSKGDSSKGDPSGKADSSRRAESGRSAAAPATGETADPVRSVYPGPRPAEPSPPRQPPAAEATPAPAPMPAPVPAPAPAVPAPSAAPATMPAPSPPPVFSPPSVATAEEPAPAPAAAGAVDLNTASVAELNGLGGGMIGKAIVARRPYASPGELLSKRVLSRATYDRIKGQVTVR